MNEGPTWTMTRIASSFVLFMLAGGIVRWWWFPLEQRQWWAWALGSIAGLLVGVSVVGTMQVLAGMVRRVDSRWR